MARIVGDGVKSRRKRRRREGENDAGGVAELLKVVWLSEA